MSDHPNAEKLGWRIRDSRGHFENKMLRLREDFLELPKAGEHRFAYIERGAGIVIVPLTADGQLVLLHQYRYPVDEHCLEVPGGSARDSGDRSFEEIAEKEMKEEIGATVGRLERIGSFYSASSITDEECHVFLALDVRLSQKAEPEPMEKIEVRLVPAREAIDLARRGEMKTGPAALAVLMCEPRLRQLGFVY